MNRLLVYVSSNSWVELYQDVGDYMMICNGRITVNYEDIYIHNSDNLIDWTDEGILVWSDTESVKKPYPTLIGDNGSSTQTSEDNMMYYQRDYDDVIKTI